MSPIELHDAMVANYYSSSSLGRMILGKMIRYIDKKRIVDIIIMAYGTITNKGHLLMIKITDEKAILNFYVETKYQDLMEIILGLYRVELNMFGKKSEVKTRVLARHGDAVCYRIVVDFKL